MAINSDTSCDVEELQLQLLRDKTPAERLMMALRLSDNVARASRQAIRRAHPEFSEVQVRQMFVEIHYGRELADGMRRHQEALENRAKDGGKNSESSLGNN